MNVQTLERKIRTKAIEEYKTRLWTKYLQPVAGYAHDLPTHGSDLPVPIPASLIDHRTGTIPLYRLLDQIKVALVNHHEQEIGNKAVTQFLDLAKPMLKAGKIGEQEDNDG